MADLAEMSAGNDPAALKSVYDYYLVMQEDFSWLLAHLPPGQEVAALLKCIADIKLASYVRPGAPLAGKLSEQQLLTDALTVVDQYLAMRPNGINRVRAEFFRAVVIFRKALPTTGSGSVDYASLQKARDILHPLADPASNEYIGNVVLPGTPTETRDIWLSYVEFYLGLVQAQTALGRSGKSRDTLASEARTHFANAIKLNNAAGGSAEFERVLEGIEAELSRPVQVEPMNDLLLEWRSVIAYDSNVPILGDHTPLPRRINHKSDVRTAGSFGFNYSFNLEAFMKKPEENGGQKDESLRQELRKWDISLAGRSAATWNGRIHEYNEQDYGSSVAIRREMLPGSSSFGPLYAGIQYDYDYFLLGNDGFLSLNRVTPSISCYTLDGKALSTLYFIYEDRDYEEPLYRRWYDRDGNYYVFGASQYVDVVDMTQFYKDLGWEPWGLANDPKPFDAEKAATDKRWDSTDYTRFLRPYVSFESGWDSTRGTEFDNTHYRFTSGLYTPLPYGLMLSTYGDWQWEDYWQASHIDYHRRNREDFIQRYGVGLERRFVLVPGLASNRRTLAIDRVVLVARADAGFTVDDSNVKDRLGEAIFQYDRQVYGLSFMLQFN